MRKQNILLYLCFGFFLTGCLQTTAMVGPAITLASTGNVSQAGISFLTDKAIKKKTGMNTLEFVSDKFDENKKKKIIKNNKKQKIIKSNEINKNNFITLVQNNFNKTRKIILIQNQSKISN